MEKYTTVKSQASFEYEDRKSIFIGDSKPVKTEEEALAFINEIKKKYSDARHHVYAYVLRENSIMRFSDDHEPQGTAGMPVLDVIRKNGCTDTVIVVTRYFGGTLLGTGGLVRAYTAAALGALRASEIITFATYVQYEISVSYSDYQKIIPIVEGDIFRSKNVEFSDSVRICGSIIKDAAEKFEREIENAVSGRIAIQKLGENFEF